MKVAAPGKLLLTGAYAVLRGAPAVVIAVDRLAIADDREVDARPSREVVAAFGETRAPRVDTRALYDGAKKLGLGSSAAVLVSSLGLRAASRGDSLADGAVRRRIFDDALAAHARAQGGGSGVDVAACVYGGALRYERAGEARIRPVALPPGLVVEAFFSGASARTSDLRARVDALASRDAEAHAGCFAALDLAAASAADAVDAGDAVAFVAAAERFGVALARLGTAAEAPIVPPAFAELAGLAGSEGAVFLPSGAGGGDVGVFLGCAAPSRAFLERARDRDVGMTALGLRLDTQGLRVVPEENLMLGIAPGSSPSSLAASSLSPLSASSEGTHHG